MTIQGAKLRQSMSVEIFREDLPGNLKFIEEHQDDLETFDSQFAKQLQQFYDTREYLTDAQISYLVGYWRELAETFSDELGV